MKKFKPMQVMEVVLCVCTNVRQINSLTLEQKDAKIHVSVIIRIETFILGFALRLLTNLY